MATVIFFSTSKTALYASVAKYVMVVPESRISPPFPELSIAKVAGGYFKSMPATLIPSKCK